MLLRWKVFGAKVKTNLVLPGLLSINERLPAAGQCKKEPRWSHGDLARAQGESRQTRNVGVFLRPNAGRQVVRCDKPWPTATLKLEGVEGYWRCFWLFFLMPAVRNALQCTQTWTCRQADVVLLPFRSRWCSRDGNSKLSFPPPGAAKCSFSLQVVKGSKSR